jgi:hypothetical protein
MSSIDIDNSRNSSFNNSRENEMFVNRRRLVLTDFETKRKRIRAIRTKSLNHKYINRHHHLEKLEQKSKQIDFGIKKTERRAKIQFGRHF